MTFELPGKIKYRALVPLTEHETSEVLSIIKKHGYEAALFSMASEYFCLYPITKDQRHALKLEQKIIYNYLKKGTSEVISDNTNPFQLLINNFRLIPMGNSNPQIYIHCSVSHKFKELDMSLSSRYDHVSLITTTFELINYDEVRNRGYGVIVDFAQNNCCVGLEAWLKVNGQSQEKNVAFFNCHRAPWPYFVKCFNTFSNRSSILLHALNWEENGGVASYIRNNYYNFKSIINKSWSYEYNNLIINGYMFDDMSPMNFFKYSELSPFMAEYRSKKVSKEARMVLKSYIAVFSDRDQISDDLRNQIKDRLASITRDRSYSYIIESAGGIMVADEHDSSKYYVHFNGEQFAIRDENEFEVKKKPFINLNNLKFRVDHLFLILETPISLEMIQMIAQKHANLSIHVLELYSKSVGKFPFRLR